VRRHGHIPLSHSGLIWGRSAPATPAYGDLTGQSLQRINQVLANFVTRGAALGITHWYDQIDEIACSKFIHCRTTVGKSASVGLQHLRRASLCVSFRSARALAFFKGDSTPDIALPPRSSLVTCPGTDDKVTFLQMAAGLDDSWYTRQPTVIALLEVGSWTSEIPWARIGDCDDLDNTTSVATAGSRRTRARLCLLTEWEQRVVRARIRYLRKQVASDVTPLVY
jgi:hypothetical protein